MGLFMKLTTKVVSREDLVEMKYIDKYEQEAADSDMDSSSEASDSDDTTSLFQRFVPKRTNSRPEDAVAGSGWLSWSNWCSIL